MDRSELNAAQVEAIEVADANLNNADLPLYSELLSLLVVVLTEVRKGPAPVIGFDRNGERQKAFDFGWNAKAEAVFVPLSSRASFIESFAGDEATA